MEWWGWLIVGILALLFVLFYRLYWRALSEARQLVNFLVLVLLKDDVREKQRANLIAFIANSNARNAAEIGTAVNLAVTDLAMRLSGNTLGVAGILWQVKREQPASK
jgi:hypothetical protein